jgi:8-oxo-dGTP pyrophosphatase MutT (NUDIX family)
MTVVQQAGAIAYRAIDGIPEILIVRAKKNPDDLIFPKGHIEPGESPEEAAVRELREEGGIEGEVVSHAGPSEYRSNGKTIHVEYFLCSYVKTVGTDEPRSPRWCSVDEALNLLTYEDVRGLLRAAVPIINSSLR